jgi:hypothetical protein
MTAVRIVAAITRASVADHRSPDARGLSSERPENSVDER